MDELVYLAYILSQPVILMAVVALFGLHYRKAIAQEMEKDGDARWATPAVDAPALAVPAASALQVQWAREYPAEAVGGAATGAMHRSRNAARAMERCFLISGGIFWSVVIVTSVWAASLRWDTATLILVAVFALAPGLIVLLNVVVRSWRTWAVIVLAYGAMATGAALGVERLSGGAARAGAPVLVIAQLYALPALAMIILVQRHVRNLLIAVVPVVLFLAAGIAVMSLASEGLGLGDVTQVARHPGLRWSGPVTFAIGVAVVPASVWVFLRILRSGARLRWGLLLAFIALAGAVLDEVLAPGYPLGPLLAAVPGGVLQCFLVWLLFKSLVSLESLRWLPPQALHFHLCWLSLALLFLAVLNVQLADLPASERWVAQGLLGAGFVGYVALLHVLLRLASKRFSGVPAKRLLFLRAFNATGKRERLLDVLDDSWRRLGRVDLIGGTDLAMRTLRSLMLECFVLRRMDIEFCRTSTDVDRRLARLASRMELDLRYPVNEVYCYADAWKTAMLALAPASDVVLLDLRAFTRANVGCQFELMHLIWYVALSRVVVLADGTTDAVALNEVAEAAWSRLPSDSPNTGSPAPQLLVLKIDKPSDMTSIQSALIRTAYRDVAIRQSA